jgi:hypothetical protein
MSQACEPLESRRHPSLVFQVPEGNQGIVKERAGRIVTALFTRQMTQIARGSGEPPAIVDLPEDAGGSFVEPTRLCDVSQFQGNVREVIGAPSHPGCIVYLGEHRRCLLQARARLLRVAEQEDDVREIA